MKTLFRHMKVKDWGDIKKSGAWLPLGWHPWVYGEEWDKRLLF